MLPCESLIFFLFSGEKLSSNEYSVIILGVGQSARSNFLFSSVVHPDSPVLVIGLGDTGILSVLIFHAGLP